MGVSFNGTILIFVYCVILIYDVVTRNKNTKEKREKGVYMFLIEWEDIFVNKERGACLPSSYRLEGEASIPGGEYRYLMQKVSRMMSLDSVNSKGVSMKKYVLFRSFLPSFRRESCVTLSSL